MREVAGRELASPVIESWLTRRERELAEEVLGRAPGRLAAIGLPASLAACQRGRGGPPAPFSTAAELRIPVTAKAG